MGRSSCGLGRFHRHFGPAHMIAHQTAKAEEEEEEDQEVLENGSVMD